MTGDRDDTAPARSIVLIGLMGAGKTSVGRRLAARLGVPFVDSDAEIEEAAGQSIPQIFETLGEPAFRSGERRVIARLLAGPPAVIATGGGAWMDAGTRAEVRAHATSVWLKASVATLAGRVKDKPGRPLLKGQDVHAVLKRLADQRYPVYAEADLTVQSGSGTAHDEMVRRIVVGLETLEEGR